MARKTQSYSNHRRFVAGYHYVLTLLVVLALGGTVWNLYRALLRGSGRLVAASLLLLAVCALLEGAYLRIFALKAQDRAIRAEENLRHFALHGSLLDPRLTTRQVVGLRFASDAELADLAGRAAEEGLSEDAIKRAVKDWREDHYRV